jgi:hypothetical protein
VGGSSRSGAEANVADDGSFRLPQEYLLAIVRF